MLLTEQAADLAAAAERGRIAREIHDGIAQLIYMLSLSSETCVALLRRIADTSTVEALMLAPVAERLDKLVTISKQALWETRHYMFTLKPLMNGSTTLTQMLTNQLREFEAISGLSTHLEVQGAEVSSNGDQRHSRKIAQVGTAIFRITQEALTNAYKHADATQVKVYLLYLPQCIEVQIRDDGKGLRTKADGYTLGTDGGQERIYSGHGMRGMRAALEAEPDLTVIGEASNGAEALAKMPVLDPQVILMDVRMEKMNGIEACREIKSRNPDVHILMITSYTDDDAVISSILAGASGYLLKQVSRADLLHSIRLVASGHSLIDSNTAKHAMERLTQVPGSELTEREREVLALVARGYTNKQIADTLFVSEKTARNHVSHILDKLGLSRRSEAAAFAVEHKLVPPREQHKDDM